MTGNSSIPDATESLKELNDLVDMLQSRFVEIIDVEKVCARIVYLLHRRDSYNELFSLTHLKELLSRLGKNTQVVDNAINEKKEFLDNIELNKKTSIVL